MSKNKLIELSEQGDDQFSDPLTDLIRNGARRIIEEALEIEIEQFVERFRDLRTANNKRRIIRNGHLPERGIVTGIGSVSVKAPRVRDRTPVASEKLQFNSEILPKYLRKTKSIEELIPWLYLKGISTGDFSEALAALIGKDAKGFSQPVISKLKSKWKDEYNNWRLKDLSKKRYVYIWVDGIHCNVRMGDKQCILVVMGATSSGKKELIALESGYRESTQSWKEVLLDIENRGLKVPPELAVADGALGFWKALAEIYPTTKWQRCWVHKTANVLNKLPKKIQPKAKIKLQDIWKAETKKDAESAFSLFIKSYEQKYPKATQCLEKDHGGLLNFYDFPAEHWMHIRTTNPIESTFATVRLRTAKVRNCFSAETVVNMAFKLCQSAEKKWRRLRGYKRLADVIDGVKFVDGISEHELKLAA